MARQNGEGRLSALEKRRLEIQQQIKATKAAVSKAKRESDARRKIVLGGAILTHFRDDDMLAELIRRVIPPHVKAKDDLALFARWLDGTEAPARSLPAAEMLDAVEQPE